MAHEKHTVRRYDDLMEEDTDVPDERILHDVNYLNQHGGVPARSDDVSAAYEGDTAPLPLWMSRCFTS